MQAPSPELIENSKARMATQTLCSTKQSYLARDEFIAHDANRVPGFSMCIPIWWMQVLSHLASQLHLIYFLLNQTSRFVKLLCRDLHQTTGN